MRPALLPLCVLALTLAACGAAPRDSAKEFQGDERAVAAAVEDLESAARDDDSEAVCTKLLAQRLLATITENGKNCATAVKDAFQDADAMELTVDDVTIRGATASAKVTSGTGAKKRTDTLELEKVGATWRITSLRA
jgi:hypothetical protein